MGFSLREARDQRSSNRRSWAACWSRDSSISLVAMGNLDAPPGGQGEQSLVPPVCFLLSIVALKPEKVG